MSQENNKVYKAIRSGTARNGAERDRGKIVHLVTKNDYPSWERAICGIDPKGNGWYYPTQTVDITCEKCLKKTTP
jgi:hypothetical protein